MLTRTVHQAGAIIWRSAGGIPEILLVRPKKQPDQWIFPKGHIEASERSDAAALREAREETGIIGRLVGPLYPALKFRSGSERVRVQYYSVAALGEGRADERREKRWVGPDAALQLLTHRDARRLLHDALPGIREDAALLAWPGTGNSSEANRDAFTEMLTSEYEHIAESLLRNEEDGEKRVTFFMTLTGAAGTALAFLLGKDPDIRPDEVNPLVACTLLIILAIGYFTFARVVNRNITTDRYKRALRRIRRYFLNGPEDPKALFLAFDPFKREGRPRASWASAGRGGWLETIVFVDALVAGALSAMLVRTSTWWGDGVVAALTGLTMWALLIWEANRRYGSQ